MIRVDHLCEVPVVRHVREPFVENRARERLDLGEPCRLPSERMPRDRCGLDAAAYASIPHVSVSGVRASVRGSGLIERALPRAKGCGETLKVVRHQPHLSVHEIRRGKSHRLCEVEAMANSSQLELELVDGRLGHGQRPRTTSAA